MSPWDKLDPRYRLVLCDIWGVVHNGVAVYPGVANRLKSWRAQQRRVILLTNAPRTADAVANQLLKLGLQSDCWDLIVTSGQAGIEALRAIGHSVAFIGTADDRTVLERNGVKISARDPVSDLACTGLEDERPRPDDYRSQLKMLAKSKVRMHCLNPDRMVIRGGRPEACAGALADIYESEGGLVAWYGKPFPAIYEHALRGCGNFSRSEVIAIGDGLQTDMLGAARMGLDAIYVAGGIHSGEPFPDDFSSRNDLGAWRPVAVVDGLA